MLYRITIERIQIPSHVSGQLGLTFDSLHKPPSIEQTSSEEKDTKLDATILSSEASPSGSLQDEAYDFNRPFDSLPYSQEEENKITESSPLAHQFEYTKIDSFQIDTSQSWNKRSLVPNEFRTTQVVYMSKKFAFSNIKTSGWACRDSRTPPLMLRFALPENIPIVLPIPSENDAFRILHSHSSFSRPTSEHIDTGDTKPDGDTCFLQESRKPSTEQTTDFRVLPHLVEIPSWNEERIDCTFFVSLGDKKSSSCDMDSKNGSRVDGLCFAINPIVRCALGVRDSAPDDVENDCANEKGVFPSSSYASPYIFMGSIDLSLYGQHHIPLEPFPNPSVLTRGQGIDKTSSSLSSVPTQEEDSSRHGPELLFENTNVQPILVCFIEPPLRATETSCEFSAVAATGVVGFDTTPMAGSPSSLHSMETVHKSSPSPQWEQTDSQGITKKSTIAETTYGDQGQSETNNVIVLNLQQSCERKNGEDQEEVLLDPHMGTNTALSSDSGEDRSAPLQCATKGGSSLFYVKENDFLKVNQEEIEHAKGADVGRSDLSGSSLKNDNEIQPCLSIAEQRPLVNGHDSGCAEKSSTISESIGSHNEPNVANAEQGVTDVALVNSSSPTCSTRDYSSLKEDGSPKLAPNEKSLEVGPVPIASPSSAPTRTLFSIQHDRFEIVGLFHEVTEPSPTLEPSHKKSIGNQLPAPQAASKICINVNTQSVENTVDVQSTTSAICKLTPHSFQDMITVRDNEHSEAVCVQDATTKQFTEVDRLMCDDGSRVFRSEVHPDSLSFQAGKRTEVETTITSAGHLRREGCLPLTLPLAPHRASHNSLKLRNERETDLKLSSDDLLMLQTCHTTPTLDWPIPLSEKLYIYTRIAPIYQLYNIFSTRPVINFDGFQLRAHSYTGEVFLRMVVLGPQGELLSSGSTFGCLIEGRSISTPPEEEELPGRQQWRSCVTEAYTDMLMLDALRSPPSAVIQLEVRAIRQEINLNIRAGDENMDSFPNANEKKKERVSGEILWIPIAHSKILLFTRKQSACYYSETTPLMRTPFLDAVITASTSKHHGDSKEGTPFGLVLDVLATSEDRIYWENNCTPIATISRAIENLRPTNQDGSFAEFGDGNASTKAKLTDAMGVYFRAKSMGRVKELNRTLPRGCSVRLICKGAYFERMPNNCEGSIFPPIALSITGGKQVILGGTAWPNLPGESESRAMITDGLSYEEEQGFFGTRRDLLDTESYSKGMNLHGQQDAPFSNGTSTSPILRYNCATHANLDEELFPSILLSFHSPHNKQTLYGCATFDPFNGELPISDHQLRCLRQNELMGDVWLSIVGVREGGKKGEIGKVHCIYECLFLSVGGVNNPSDYELEATTTHVSKSSENRTVDLRDDLVYPYVETSFSRTITVIYEHAVNNPILGSTHRRIHCVARLQLPRTLGSPKIWSTNDSGAQILSIPLTQVQWGLRVDPTESLEQMHQGLYIELFDELMMDEIPLLSVLFPSYWCSGFWLRSSGEEWVSCITRSAKGVRSGIRVLFIRWSDTSRMYRKLPTPTLPTSTFLGPVPSSSRFPITCAENDSFFIKMSNIRVQWIWMQHALHIRGGWFSLQVEAYGEDGEKTNWRRFCLVGHPYLASSSKPETSSEDLEGRDARKGKQATLPNVAYYSIPVHAIGMPASRRIEWKVLHHFCVTDGLSDSGPEAMENTGMHESPLIDYTTTHILGSGSWEVPSRLGIFSSGTSIRTCTFMYGHAENTVITKDSKGIAITDRLPTFGGARVEPGKLMFDFSSHFIDSLESPKYLVQRRAPSQWRWPHHHVSAMLGICIKGWLPVSARSDDNTCLPCARFTEGKSIAVRVVEQVDPPSSGPRREETLLDSSLPLFPIDANDYSKYCTNSTKERDTVSEFYAIWHPQRFYFLPLLNLPVLNFIIHTKSDDSSSFAEKGEETGLERIGYATFDFQSSTLKQKGRCWLRVTNDFTLSTGLRRPITVGYLEISYRHNFLDSSSRSVDRMLKQKEDTAAMVPPFPVDGSCEFELGVTNESVFSASTMPFVLVAEVAHVRLRETSLFPHPLSVKEDGTMSFASKSSKTGSNTTGFTTQGERNPEEPELEYYLVLGTAGKYSYRTRTHRGCDARCSDCLVFPYFASRSYADTEVYIQAVRVRHSNAPLVSERRGTIEATLPNESYLDHSEDVALELGHACVDLTYFEITENLNERRMGETWKWIMLHRRFKEGVRVVGEVLIHFELMNWDSALSTFSRRDFKVTFQSPFSLRNLLLATAETQNYDQSLSSLFAEEMYSPHLGGDKADRALLNTVTKEKPLAYFKLKNMAFIGNNKFFRDVLGHLYAAEFAWPATSARLFLRVVVRMETDNTCCIRCRHNHPSSCGDADGEVHSIFHQKNLSASPLPPSNHTSASYMDQSPWIPVETIPQTTPLMVKWPDCTFFFPANTRSQSTREENLDCVVQHTPCTMIAEIYASKSPLPCESQKACIVAAGRTLIGLKQKAFSIPSGTFEEVRIPIALTLRAGDLDFFLTEDSQPITIVPAGEMVLHFGTHFSDRIQLDDERSLKRDAGNCTISSEPLYHRPSMLLQLRLHKLHLFTSTCFKSPTSEAAETTRTRLLDADDSHPMASAQWTMEIKKPSSRKGDDETPMIKRNQGDSFMRLTPPGNTYARRRFLIQETCSSTDTESTRSNNQEVSPPTEGSGEFLGNSRWRTIFGADSGSNIRVVLYEVYLVHSQTAQGIVATSRNDQMNDTDASSPQAKSRSRASFGSLRYHREVASGSFVISFPNTMTGQTHKVMSCVADLLDPHRCDRKIGSVEAEIELLTFYDALVSPFKLFLTGALRGSIRALTGFSENVSRDPENTKAAKSPKSVSQVSLFGEKKAVDSTRERSSMTNSRKTALGWGRNESKIGVSFSFVQSSFPMPASPSSLQLLACCFLPLKAFKSALMFQNCPSNSRPTIIDLFLPFRYELPALSSEAWKADEPFEEIYALFELVLSLAIFDRQPPSDSRSKADCFDSFSLANREKLPLMENTFARGTWETSVPTPLSFLSSSSAKRGSLEPIKTTYGKQRAWIPLSTRIPNATDIRTAKYDREGHNEDERSDNDHSNVTNECAFGLIESEWCTEVCLSDLVLTCVGLEVNMDTLRYANVAEDSFSLVLQETIKDNLLLRFIFSFPNGQLYHISFHPFKQQNEKFVSHHVPASREAELEFMWIFYGLLFPTIDHLGASLIRVELFTCIYPAEINPLKPPVNAGPKKTWISSPLTPPPCLTLLGAHDWCQKDSDALCFCADEDFNSPGAREGTNDRFIWLSFTNGARSLPVRLLLSSRRISPIMHPLAKLTENSICSRGEKERTHPTGFFFVIHSATLDLEMRSNECSESRQSNAFSDFFVRCSLVRRAQGERYSPKGPEQIICRGAHPSSCTITKLPIKKAQTILEQKNADKIQESTVDTTLTTTVATGDNRDVPPVSSRDEDSATFLTKLKAIWQGDRHCPTSKQPDSRNAKEELDFALPSQSKHFLCQFISASEIGKENGKNDLSSSFCFEWEFDVVEHPIQLGKEELNSKSNSHCSFKTSLNIAKHIKGNLGKIVLPCHSCSQSSSSSSLQNVSHNSTNHILPTGSGTLILDWSLEMCYSQALTGEARMPCKGCSERLGNNFFNPSQDTHCSQMDETALLDMFFTSDDLANPIEEDKGACVSCGGVHWLHRKIKKFGIAISDIEIRDLSVARIHAPAKILLPNTSAIMSKSCLSGRGETGKFQDDFSAPSGASSHEIVVQLSLPYQDGDEWFAEKGLDGIIHKNDLRPDLDKAAMSRFPKFAKTTAIPTNRTGDTTRSPFPGKISPLCTARNTNMPNDGDDGGDVPRRTDSENCSGSARYEDCTFSGLKWLIDHSTMEKSSDMTLTVWLRSTRKTEQGKPSHVILLGLLPLEDVLRTVQEGHEHDNQDGICLTSLWCKMSSCTHSDSLLDSLPSIRLHFRVLNQLVSDRLLLFSPNIRIPAISSKKSMILCLQLLHFSVQSRHNRSLSKHPDGPASNNFFDPSQSRTIHDDDSYPPLVLLIRSVYRDSTLCSTPLCLPKQLPSQSRDESRLDHLVDAFIPNRSHVLSFPVEDAAPHLVIGLAELCEEFAPDSALSGNAPPIMREEVSKLRAFQFLDLSEKIQRLLTQSHSFSTSRYNTLPSTDACIFDLSIDTINNQGESITLISTSDDELKISAKIRCCLYRTDPSPQQDRYTVKRTPVSNNPRLEEHGLFDKCAIDTLSRFYYEIPNSEGCLGPGCVVAPSCGTGLVLSSRYFDKKTLSLLALAFGGICRLQAKETDSQEWDGTRILFWSRQGGALCRRKRKYLDGKVSASSCDTRTFPLCWLGSSELVNPQDEGTFRVINEHLLNRVGHSVIFCNEGELLVIDGGWRVSPELLFRFAENHNTRQRYIWKQPEADIQPAASETVHDDRNLDSPISHVPSNTHKDASHADRFCFFPRWTTITAQLHLSNRIPTLSSVHAGNPAEEAKSAIRPYPSSRKSKKVVVSANRQRDHFVESKEELYTYIHHSAVKKDSKIWYFGGWMVTRREAKVGLMQNAREEGSIQQKQPNSFPLKEGNLQDFQAMELCNHMRYLELTTKQHYHVSPFPYPGSEPVPMPASTPFESDRVRTSYCQGVHFCALRPAADSTKGGTDFPIGFPPGLALHVSFTWKSFIFVFGGLIEYVSDMNATSSTKCLIASDALFAFHTEHLCWYRCTPACHDVVDPDGPTNSLCSPFAWPAPRYGHSIAAFPNHPQGSVLIFGGAQTTEAIKAPSLSNFVEAGTEQSSGVQKSVVESVLVPIDEIGWIFNAELGLWRKLLLPQHTPLTSRFLPCIDILPIDPFITLGKSKTIPLENQICEWEQRNIVPFSRAAQGYQQCVFLIAGGTITDFPLLSLDNESDSNDINNNNAATLHQLKLYLDLVYRRIDQPTLDTVLLLIPRN